MTEDEMVGWHHWLNGHGFEHAVGDDDGQGGLACCSSWGHKELDRTEWLNNSNNIETYGLQDWVASGQITNREGTQPHPSADNCIKVSFSMSLPTRASLVAQLVKNLPAMQETWVQSLGWENPLEKGKTTHSSILAWRILCTVWTV